MKRLLSFIRRAYAHYQTKLLLAFLLCTFIPVCLIAGISYRQSYKIAEKQIMDAAIFSAHQINTQLNARIMQAENASDALQYSMYTLLQTDQAKTTDYINRFTETRNNIDLFESSFDFCHIFAFLNEKQFGSCEGLYFFPISKLQNWNITDDMLVTIGTDSLWITQKNVVLPYVFDPSSKPIDGVACCRARYNHALQSVDYAFLIFLSEDSFQQCMNYAEDSPVQTYILDQSNGTVFSSSPQKTPHISFQNASQYAQTKTQSYSDNQFHFHCLPLSNGWCQVTEIPNSYIETSTIGIIKWIVISLIIFIPLVSLIIWFLVRKLSIRIKRLSTAMDNYNLKAADENTASDILLPHNPLDFDELDKLCISFGNMQDSIRQSLDSIVNYKITEERLKYQLLQSQINPHFLYNILGSIQYCQSLGKLTEASQMLTDLTKFYRLSLRKSGELILIKDELEIAEAYLRIEKLCQKGELAWSINLEDGIENFAICKFTIQPFLENAILHGITDSHPDIHIEISASYGDSTVIITIRDNGSGMPPEKLEEIRHSMEEKTIHYDYHFGICNVYNRISNPYYGNGKMQIESILDKGTKIQLEFSQMDLEV